jgi:t-SNARE complex subunit (syntaxin)
VEPLSIVALIQIGPVAFFLAIIGAATWGFAKLTKVDKRVQQLTQATQNLQQGVNTNIAASKRSARSALIVSIVLAAVGIIATILVTLLVVPAYL